MAHDCQKLVSGLEEYYVLEEDYILHMMHMPGKSFNESLSILQPIWDSMDSKT